LKRFHLPSVPKFIGHCYQGIAAKPLSSGLSTSQDTKEFFTKRWKFDLNWYGHSFNCLYRLERWSRWT